MILIYSQNTSARLEFICKLIFFDILGIQYKITTNTIEFLDYNNAKINYSNTDFDDAVEIKPHHLLFEKGINRQNITVTLWNDLPVFFQKPSVSELPFDIFAASFYLVSRYEEYLTFIPDIHNRFSAKQSLAYKNGFLEKPIVNQWVMLLKNILEQKFPEIKFPEKKYNFISTIDVDNAYAYLNKGFLRTFAATFLSILKFNFNDNVRRYKVLLKKSNDPFNTFNYIRNIHDKYNIKPVYFFLVGKYGKYDKNISVKNSNFQKLIKDLSVKFEIGIHPSYNSNKDIEILKNEKNNLSEIINKEIKKSRNHFLKICFPSTYQNLLKSGITEEHSMAYASCVGFRASICTPFKFYDLALEKETELTVYPFAIMDATLKYYLKYDINDAIDKTSEIINEIKKVNGTFISLWHNESLSEIREWKNWKKVFEKMIQLAIND
ncbi:MAG: polysaccharide deacetylase family protein [Bacteroidales bacterium]|nr:polysaccharide deacetylase family protein [Bacteroidales bacterium]